MKGVAYSMPMYDVIVTETSIYKLRYEAENEMEAERTARTDVDHGYVSEDSIEITLVEVLELELAVVHSLKGEIYEVRRGDAPALGTFHAASHAKAFADMLNAKGGDDK